MCWGKIERLGEKGKIRKGLSLGKTIATTAANSWEGMERELFTMAVENGPSGTTPLWSYKSNQTFLPRVAFMVRVLNYDSESKRVVH